MAKRLPKCRAMWVCPHSFSPKPRKKPRTYTKPFPIRRIEASQFFAASQGPGVGCGAANLAEALVLIKGTLSTSKLIRREKKNPPSKIEGDTQMRDRISRRGHPPGHHVQSSKTGLICR